MAGQNNFFDWSMLDRNAIAQKLWELNGSVVKQKLKVSEVHELLSNQIKAHYPVRTRKKYSFEVDPGIIFIGGLYCSDSDKHHKKCIEIQFVYHKRNDIIEMSRRNFWRLCVCFADTLLHEIIHMRQFRRRNFKFLPEYASNAEKSEQRQEQNYLGCSDEIDAYSFNIACELLVKFNGDQKRLIQYLGENQKNKKRKNNCWRMYLKAFDHDHSHQIIKRLKKKIIRYIPHAETGKPYKNKDWINW